MKKNDVVILNIIALGSNFEGVAYYEGYTFFVTRAIVGETVKAKVTYVKKNIAYAQTLEIIEKADCRVEPKCNVFGRCGGCDIQHISYAKQLEFKQSLVKNTLKKITGIDALVNEVFASDKIYGYRNKLSLPLKEKNGKIVSGFFEQNTHDIVDNQECFLQEVWAKKLVDIVKNYMQSNCVKPYNFDDNSGVMRHIVGRYVDGQLLVTLVANTADLPNLTALIDMLGKEFDKFGLFVNVNTLQNNVILSNDTRHIFGLEFISSKQFGVEFCIRPNSFYQVNEFIKNNIYSTVKKILDSEKIDLLIDAFSGVGLLSGALYSDQYQTVAIEIEPSAVADAEQMKEKNGLKNLTNICGDVEKELPIVIENFRKGEEVFAEKNTKNFGTINENAKYNLQIDTQQSKDKILNKDINDNGEHRVIALVVDPPRKGLSTETVNTILSALPEKVIYVSCDPTTLARDLKSLLSRYALSFIQPFDMFPQTKHIETLVCLALKEAKRGKITYFRALLTKIA